MKKSFYLTTKKFSCGFDVENGKIVKTAPILSKFLNQKVENLFEWLEENFEDYHMEKI